MRFNDYWKIPKNAKQYFSPKYEKQLKKRYGVWYTFHTVISVILAFVPLVVFFLISPENAFSPSTQIDNILGGVAGIVGVIGSLSIGVGFVNVFMLLIKQYLGHWITIISIFAGILLDTFSLFLFSFVG